MSWAACTWVRNLRVRSSSHKLILLLLADHADGEDSCFPSQETLAEEAMLTSRTVRTILGELEEDGLIARVRRHRKDGTRTSDRLTLLFRGLPEKRDLPEITSGSQPSGDYRKCASSTTGNPRHGLPEIDDTDYRKPFPGNEPISRKHQLEADTPTSDSLPSSGNHSPGAARAKKSAKRVPLPADFAWTDKAVLVADDLKIPRPAHETILAEFKHYWIGGDGAGTQRPDWERTFIKRLSQIAVRYAVRPQPVNGSTSWPNGYANGQRRWIEKTEKSVAELDEVWKARLTSEGRPIPPNRYPPDYKLKGKIPDDEYDAWFKASRIYDKMYFEWFGPHQ